MKDWIISKFKALSAKLKAWVAPKLEKASAPVQIALVALLVVIGVAGVVALIVALVAFLFVLPGAFFGGLCWLVWTYFGLGATYFPALDPLYLTIPFWHFVGAASVLIFFLKMLRPRARVEKKPDTVNNVFGGRSPLK